MFGQYTSFQRLVKRKPTQNIDSGYLNRVLCIWIKKWNMTTLHKIYRAIYPAKDSEDLIREYHIPRTLNLQVRLTKDGWFAASVPELPGLITQAQTQEELLSMVNDAVLTYFDVPKSQADMVYNQLKFTGVPVVQYEAQLRAA